MKILICPLNGPRNVNEFQYYGPVRSVLDPNTASDREWTRSLFRFENKPGTIEEWWRHVPSNTFFIAERDIVSNDVIRTFLPSEKEQNA